LKSIWVGPRSLVQTRSLLRAIK